VHSDAVLAVDEHVLPVGFDGEFYLPLGTARRRADGTEIRLTRLPVPTSGGQRSITGSIKIYFQKVVSQRLGLEFPYPRLTAATVDEKGHVTYGEGAATVKQKVTDATRLLLYIHGILGDTLGMAASTPPHWLHLPTPSPALGTRYDLILTFDYENINTSIEENARLLKKRLEEVGLGPNHGKTVHIVAHSMGGLVARWFIEREGGNQVAQHLVMLGTPNAGSPWPSLEDWVTTTIGIGLNSLSAVVWPVRALGALVGGIETIDITLDEMKPGSQFLQTLTGSPDPGIPYTIIVGNTSIIAAALKSEDGKEQSRLARLWAKLTAKNWLYDATGLAFFGATNDIAVSVASSQTVPDARSPQPKKVDPVACDHLTYFSTAAGLQALADALLSNVKSQYAIHHTP